CLRWGAREQPRRLSAEPAAALWLPSFPPGVLRCQLRCVPDSYPPLVGDHTRPATSNRRPADGVPRGNLLSKFSYILRVLSIVALDLVVSRVCGAFRSPTVERVIQRGVAPAWLGVAGDGRRSHQKARPVSRRVPAGR